MIGQDFIRAYAKDLEEARKTLAKAVVEHIVREMIKNPPDWFAPFLEELQEAQVTAE